MSEPTTVLLYELEHLALIVPSSTNVVYRNQTGGHACIPSDLEGYLIPFAGEVGDACNRLRLLFTGLKWGGWCSDRIDEETADEVDSVLAHVARRGEILVDRTKLNESWEAWVHVKINGPLVSLVEHARPSAAILTWSNSD